MRWGWCAVLLIGCGASAAATPTTAPLAGDTAPPTSDTRSPPMASLLGPTTHNEPRATTSSHTAPPAPALIVLPVGRTDGAPSSDPALAAATAAYARLEQMSFSLPSAPDTTSTVTELVARARLAAATAEDVQDVCAPLEIAGGLRVDALSLEADAFDLAASRIRADEMPLPADLQAQFAGASAALRSELLAAFRRQAQASLAGMIRRLYCHAVRSYTRLLAFDPTNARARAQLAAYGDEFVQSCASR